MSRVPAVTAWFWLVKTMITAAGGTWPDYLYAHLGRVVTSALLGVGLVVALVVQFRVGRYRAWVFWPVLVVVGVAGTELANGPHTVLGAPYVVVALGFLVVLGALLRCWRVSAETLSPRRVDTVRREAFYWATTVAAFALGTALTHLGLPLLVSLGLLAGVAIAWRWFGLGAAAAFWSAHVLTRPFGTALAVLAATRLGAWPVTAVFAGAVVLAVAYLAVSERDVLAPVYEA